MDEKLNNLFQRTKRIVLLTIKKAMDPYFSGNAAEVAFFLLMSLVPTMILLAQILDLFTMSMDAIKTMLEEYVSSDINEIILPLLDYKSSDAMSIALLLLAFWSGSKAIFCLMRISNYAYSTRNHSRNPLFGYIRERIRAVFTIFIILFTLVFAINIVIFGKVLLEMVLSYLNVFMGGNHSVDDIWLNIRWPVAFIMYFCMVTSIYYLLPSLGNSYKHLITKNKIKTIKRILGAWISNSKNTLRIIFPGSFFASIGMLVATWVYSLYLAGFSSNNFNILYGSLGAAVLLLLWFYILSYIIVLGIQINSIWEDSKHSGEITGKYGGDKNE